MILKNVKSDLDVAFKALEVYAAAKQHLSHESIEITNATKASIGASNSASTASGKKRQELLGDAETNAEKAGKILVQLQKRLKEDYGKFWRQDLISSAIFAIPEQEIVEAFALLAVLKQTEVPSRIINFRTQDLGSYLKTKTTLKVSNEAYIFGLLDCVGELGRVIEKSLDRPEFAVQIFTTMQELFGELERFMEFPNRKDPKIEKDRKSAGETESHPKAFSNLKHRIDVCRNQVLRCRKLLGNIDLKK